MTHPIDLPLDDDDRLAEPPLLDLFHHERDPDGFSITFVPSFGDDATRCVFVPCNSPEGRQVSAFVDRVQELIGNRLDKVTHRGGGDYTLRLASGQIVNLSDEGVVSAPEVFDRLKQIAETAEAAFLISQTGHP